MPRPATLALLLWLTGCASTAPYTVGAAAINSAVAVGAAAATRSAGGCWAICTDGWVCNPASGWCEKPRATLPSECPPGSATNDPRCAPWPQPTVTGQGGAPATGSGLGLSPASGKAPPPPNESSPGGPPRP